METLENDSVQRLFQRFERELARVFASAKLVSDIPGAAELPDEVRANLALASACVGGAATIEETEKMLKETGFGDTRILPKDESRELIRKWASGGNAEDHVDSATIEAVKTS